MAGWGDNDAKDGIPVYMNEQCFCVVNAFVMTRAGTEKMGPWGPVGAGQMAASCPAAWGWSLVAVLALAGAGYAGGGLAYNVKVNGMAPTAEALPHRPFWSDVAMGVKVI
jgi:hypothetical protein